MTEPGMPDAELVLSYFETLSNWKKWGAADQLGTLNYVNRQVRRAAAELVEEGVTISCGRDIRATAWPGEDAGLAQRFMITTGQGVASGTDGEVPGKSAPILRARGAFAAEYFGLIFHGPSVTHLDALSHAFWDGMMYNGRPAAHVTAKDGALEGSMSQLGGGITTRGVLIDLPRLFGTNWLDAGHGVTPGEILAAEDRQGVTIRSGDFLLLRTGDPRRREVTQDTGRQRAGYSASCLPLLHAREVAAIGCDTANDSVPSGFNPGGVAVEPVHMVGIVAMGLWILDNCDFEELAETCARLERYEFLFTVANLRINGATGSPVNPIALL